MKESDSFRGNPGLKALREKAGLNRQQMAKATGVTARQWQRYENEGSLPERVEVILNIAALSETPVDEALELMGFSFPSKQELLSKIERITDALDILPQQKSTQE